MFNPRTAKWLFDTETRILTNDMKYFSSSKGSIGAPGPLGPVGPSGGRVRYVP